MGRDEIYWWINRREPDIPQFTERANAALKASQALKEASLALKKLDVESFAELVEAFQRFARQQLAHITVLHDFARWLYLRDRLAPSILFTYKVWGSSRRGDRSLSVALEAESPEEETAEAMQALTQTAWGFVSAGFSHYVRAGFEVGSEVYEAGPSKELRSENEVVVPDARVVRRAERSITDECAVFFEFVRNSLRDIELELQNRRTREHRLTSDQFWRSFIVKARKSLKAEPELWDFKETLSFWHVSERNAKTA